jgi:hypothetical protein
MEVSGQVHAPSALSSGKEPPDSRLGGLQSRSGRDGEEKNPFIAPVGNRTPLAHPLS